MKDIKCDLMKNLEQIIEEDLQTIHQVQREQDKEYFKNELKKHLEAYLEATTNWAEILYWVGSDGYVYSKERNERTKNETT